MSLVPSSGDQIFSAGTEGLNRKHQGKQYARWIADELLHQGKFRDLCNIPREKWGSVWGNCNTEELLRQGKVRYEKENSRMTSKLVYSCS